MQGLGKIAAARRVARMKLPYFTQLLESLAPVEVPGLGTFGVTEHLALIYDPVVLEEWPLKKVAFVIAHEGMHIFNHHLGRSKRLGIVPGSDDAWLWNLAGDSQINRILQQVFGWVPDDAMLPERMELDGVVFALPSELVNATTEEIYKHLKNLRQKQKAEKQEGKPSKRGVCNGKCGSGAGNKIKGEIDAKHPASRSPATVESVIKATALAVEAAATDAKMRGSVPLGLLRDVRALLDPPKIPWTRELDRNLRHAVQRRAGAVDYGWSGISKKQFAVGFGDGCPVLPKLFAPQVEVDFVIDTSGSMGQADLGAAMREAAGVLRAIGTKCMFTAIDAHIHEQKKVRTIEEAMALVKGGGGTDFRPYFAALAERRKADRPNVIVFATDGYGPAPHEPPPNTHVIWLLIGQRSTVPFSGTTHDHVTWGTVIRCTD